MVLEGYSGRVRYLQRYKQYGRWVDIWISDELLSQLQMLVALRELTDDLSAIGQS
jgi:hypothetical protein